MDYITRGEFQAALESVKEDVELHTGEIGTLKEEMAAVKADIDNNDRWFEHIDKRFDDQDQHLDSRLNKQDDSLKWILRGIVLAIITFACYLAVYVVEHHA